MHLIKDGIHRDPYILTLGIHWDPYILTLTTHTHIKYITVIIKVNKSNNCNNRIIFFIYLYFQTMNAQFIGNKNVVIKIKSTQHLSGKTFIWYAQIENI